mmetsp:Transcript_1164/g.3501  ORF Transcript_1164/g.3501 Transcript_1164/m.3501 type:complete len:81 (+) Transcript_1164:69-311(+)
MPAAGHFFVSGRCFQLFTPTDVAATMRRPNQLFTRPAWLHRMAHENTFSSRERYTVYALRLNERRACDPPPATSSTIDGS